MSEYYIGLMTGTSIDSIDAALVDLADNKIQILEACQYSIADDLKSGLHNLVNTQSTSLANLVELETKLSEHYALAILKLLGNSTLTHQHIIAAGCHGQTVFHHPDSPIQTSVQLLNSHLVAEHSKINIVSDFRRADIAAGGQGAPLAPVFHQALFSSPTVERAIINIGGIANISVLTAGAPKIKCGYDTGPGNTLIDHYCQSFFNLAYDDNGNIAASGQIHREMLNRLLDDPYFTQSPPKSTGREYFNATWLEQTYPELNFINQADLICTLTELTAISICKAITDHAREAKEIVICGGGARNAHLMKRISELSAGRHVMPSAELGINEDYVESAGFAWLARQAFEKQLLDLTVVTGASHPVVYGQVTYTNLRY